MKQRTDIQIKRVYEPVEMNDGARVLVDRLWPRGVSKEHAALTLWLKEIAPIEVLRKWFDHDPERWEEFVRRYRAELAHNEAALNQLRGLMQEGHVALLYAAHDSEHNNAVVLAAYLRDQPILEPMRASNKRSAKSPKSHQFGLKRSGQVRSRVPI